MGRIDIKQLASLCADKADCELLEEVCQEQPEANIPQPEVQHAYLIVRKDGMLSPVGYATSRRKAEKVRYQLGESYQVVKIKNGINNIYKGRIYDNL